MKKFVLVLSLAMVLVFAFASAAGAVYAGFEKTSGYGGPGTYPYNPAAGMTGYLPWAEAQAQMAVNGVSAEDTRSAHGGYTTATTKCFACHSAHRATYVAGASVRVNASLGGSATCDLCHNSSSTATDRMIEWGDTTTSHEHLGKSCTQCHRGSVHGRDLSAYGAMNLYMLGGDRDEDIAVFAASGLIPNDANGLPMFDFVTTEQTMSGWFKNGTAAPGADSNLPSEGGYTLFNWGAGVAGELSSPSAGTFAAAKSLATAVTCNRAGCHTSSAFGVFAFGALDVTSDATTTGHTMPIYRPNYTSDATCGPCHPGAAVGGYRNLVDTADNTLASRSEAGSWTDATGVDGAGVATLQTGSTAVTVEEYRRARGYGCEQCHDAIGAVTKTTAFPHATNGINVFEWAANGDRSSVAAEGDNLWMYAADINWTLSTIASESIPSAMYKATGALESVSAMPAVTEYSQAFTFITDAKGASEFGKVSDGACLKCHVEAKATPNRPLVNGNRHAGVSWTAKMVEGVTVAVQTEASSDWTSGATNGLNNVGSAIISLQW